MFPNSFSARVAERMAIWGALLGFLLFLYGAIEVIQASRMTEILRRPAAGDRRALMAHVEAQAPGTRSTRAAPNAARRSRSGSSRSISARPALRDSHRQNKLLIGLLALFVVGMILFLEYRWLVKPIVRMAAVLRKRRDLLARA